MPLYLILLLCSISVPLVLSFDKKVGFYKLWPFLFPSIFLTGILFVSLDVYFAKKGIWGFNPEYHSGIMLSSLPLEEWLFFIVIPYSSIFIHYVLNAYFPEKQFSPSGTRLISFALIAVLLFATLLNTGRLYTVTYFSLMIIVIAISLLLDLRLLHRFYFSFLVILIPFIIINGILTGSFIEGEVVWYKSAEIIGFRILTIPVEDFAYGFSLIMINLLLMNYFRKVF